MAQSAFDRRLERAIAGARPRSAGAGAEAQTGDWQPASVAQADTDADQATGPSTVVRGPSKYVSPDDIWNRDYNDRVAFIFIPATGRLLVPADGDPEATHWRVIRENLAELVELTGVLAKLDEDDGSEEWQDKLEQALRHELTKVALLGRAGTFDLPGYPEGHYVSFWPARGGVMERGLKQCLEELTKIGAVGPDSFVSTPGAGTVPLGRSGEAAVAVPDADTAERVELMRQLHLMKPDAKKAAMARLGLAHGGKKNEWQSGLEAAGVARPGQKWWALSSEGAFGRRLDGIVAEMLDAYVGLIIWDD